MDIVMKGMQRVCVLDEDAGFGGLSNIEQQRIRV